MRVGVHRPSLRAALVVVCALLLLGHVCELPLHHSVLAAAGHGAGAHEHPAGGHGHAVVEEGSCEAASTVSPHLVAPAVAGSLSAPGAPVAASRDCPSAPARSVVAPSPPLFLLHAALLI
jgi:hypothetical protein